jgi:hypothetical protein
METLSTKTLNRMTLSMAGSIATLSIKILNRMTQHTGLNGDTHIDSAS